MSEWQELEDFHGVMQAQGAPGALKRLWDAARSGDLAAALHDLEAMGYEVDDVVGFQMNAVPDNILGEYLTACVLVAPHVDRAIDEEIVLTR